MSVVDDVFTVTKWMARIMAILPALKKFWDGVKASDDANSDLTGQQVANALELQRAISRQQAKEELEG